MHKSAYDTAVHRSVAVLLKLDLITLEIQVRCFYHCVHSYVFACTIEHESSNDYGDQREGCAQSDEDQLYKPRMSNNEVHVL